MRERKDIFKMLKAAGLPTTYRQWKPAKPPAMPYVVYLEQDRRDFHADNSNYVKRRAWCVELYSEAKDEESEAAIEQVFEQAGISYSRTEHDPRDYAATEAASLSGYYMVAWHFETI